MRFMLLSGAILWSSLCVALEPTLYLSGNGTANGVPGGPPLRVTGAVSYVAGQKGQALSLPAGCFLTFPSKSLLDKSQGAVAFWLKPNWNGDDGENHALLADVSNFDDKLQNTLYLWKWSTGLLRLDLRSPADQYVTYGVRHWRAGEWHHIGASWDVKSSLALFVDGQCVARRRAAYEPRLWPTFNIGGDWAGRGTGDCVIDELYLYHVPLQAAHIAALKEGLPLEEIAVLKIDAPPTVKINEPFLVSVQAQALQPLTRSYPLLVLVDGVEIARFPGMPDDVGPQKPLQALALPPLSVVIPSYLRVPPGKHHLTVQFEGAIEPPAGPAVSARIEIVPPAGQRHEHKYEISSRGEALRNRQPFIPVRPDEGFLYEGVFYTNDEAGRAKACQLIQEGKIHDALRVRLIDSVDCTQEDHHFRQWGASTVKELLPGHRFRITGAPESVQEQIDVYGQKRPVLPGFAYTMATTPLPRPHILVAELPNDRERYTEIAIDAAAGSRLAPHLAHSGPGDTRLINLSVLYTGREYPCNQKLLRHCIVFYPKSEACDVIITSSQREQERSLTSGAAVSRLAVYEILDDETGLYNPIAAPPDFPQRTAALFFPEHRFLYTQWGFSGEGDQQRRASLLALFDYMKFLGLNRLEFHPVSFGMSCFYNGGMLPNAAAYDVFEDILPLAEEAGIQIVPALDGMAFYDKFPEFTDESFQLDRDGLTYRHYFGKVPDPLRPEVQARLMAFMSEFLEKTRGSAAVPMISFKVNGKMGTCYSGDSPEHPAEDAGYSEWDIAEFEKDTGLTVGGTKGDTRSRYEWLRAEPERWQKWMDWRCQRTKEFWLKVRDLVVSRGKKALLIKTILPDNHPGYFNFWQKRQRSPLEVLRGHGYDPRLYVQERGLRFTRCLLVGSDRYFGQEANKTWQYDDTQAEFYRTAEGTETEIYFIYWELPHHPQGFRVGPACGPERAFFEPLTYTLRMHNPYNITFYNWYPGTIGHELQLRRFIRAYRALPAVPGRAFAGQIFPQNPRLCARWHGERLAVINDTNKPCTIRLTFPERFPLGTIVKDVGNNVSVPYTLGHSTSRVEISLEAWDLATLEILVPGHGRPKIYAQ